MFASRSSAPARTPDGSSHRRDVTDASVSLVPRLPHRWSAWWAGGRDGRRGVTPDPETGLTPYLHMLCATNATMVESERLRSAGFCAPIDTERTRLVEQRECSLRALADTDSDSDSDSENGLYLGGAGDDDIARIRAQRARHAKRQQLRAIVDAASEQIAVLDERRADRVTVGALRIRRCTERTEQLVAHYWRAFQRRHPELPELRAGYSVPSVPVPAHPLEP